MRKKVPQSVAIQVLTEAGYRCAVPTCRNILALDLHHIVSVVEEGPNEAGNLLALCPTCHALFGRGTIARESIYAWKLMLVSLSQAFDTETIDYLLFLDKSNIGNLRISGDGVLNFSRLIAADLADFQMLKYSDPHATYSVRLSEKGRNIVEAWKSGDRRAVEEAMVAACPSEKN